MSAKIRIVRNGLFLMMIGCQLLFSNCSKCVHREETVDLMAPNFIPYQGTESIKFKDSLTGVVHTFTGQGYTTEYKVDYTQEDCPIKYNLQSKSIRFTNDIISKAIVITQQIPGTYTSVEDIEINFDRTMYTEMITSFSNPFLIDSINIGGKYYYDVRYFTRADLGHPVKTGCYFNTQKGLLKMELEGNVWEIVE